MRGKAAACCGVALFCAAYLLAQGAPRDDTTSRAVQGIVTEAGGQPVAKAVVQLKNTRTLQIRSFITGADGRYHFAGLASDIEFQLKAEHEGTTTPWKTLSMYNTKKLVEINFKLSK